MVYCSLYILYEFIWIGWNGMMLEYELLFPLFIILLFYKTCIGFDLLSWAGFIFLYKCFFGLFDLTISSIFSLMTDSSVSVFLDSSAANGTLTNGVSGCGEIRWSMSVLLAYFTEPFFESIFDLILESWL